MLTYNNLFSSVLEEIIKHSSYPSTTSWKDQLSKSMVLSPVSLSVSSVAVDSGALSNTLHDLLSQLLPAAITSGLAVVATDPPSNQVTIKAGTGVVAGKIYILKLDVTIPISFDSHTTVFYVNLYVNGVQIEREEKNNQLLLARIIIPNPGTTSRVQDYKDDNNLWDAYIVGRKEFHFYGDDYGNFEEDSLEIFRKNIGDILAENLIGNIRLSENLKIINTAGSIELDSNSLKIKNEDAVVMAKFNRNGVYFYDRNKVEMARFTSSDARIGNILITKNSLQSSNYLSLTSGFQIKDDGNVEFNDLIVRGTVYATAGEIGGWTIASDSIYATTTGTIKTSANVGAGYNGVIIDKDGLRVYDDVLGVVINLPSDGSAPSFTSGIIQNTIFEINTNAILRTSETVGDETANSAGILINNTGLYGCGSNQLLGDANLKALIDGTISLKGQIVAVSGMIGNVTITAEGLYGGYIETSLTRSNVIETSLTPPRVRIDSTGILYQETTNIGKYGTVAGGYGFQYGSGTRYGSGVAAYLFNSAYPMFTIAIERNNADIRFYNRGAAPTAGTHLLGDMLVINNLVNFCYTSGAPGLFIPVGGYIENRTNDTGCIQPGRMWLRTDL